VLHNSRNAINVYVGKAIDDTGFEKTAKSHTNGSLVVDGGGAAAKQLGNVIRTKAKILGEEFKGSSIGAIEF
jgi:hypothetical protein